MRHVPISFVWFFVVFLVSFLAINRVDAAAILDTDSDGISDYDEVHVYHTDPHNADTDSDGYSDGLEVSHGYSPLQGKKKTLEQVDTDKDGLSDRFEIAFGTDITLRDTDGDGHADKDEIVKGFDPRTSEPKKIKKTIKVSLSTQRMNYVINDTRLATYVISSGKWNLPTPTGEFTIINKSPRAWSKLAGLWMPYWMGFKGGKFGIHDLPEWPNGTKEGANHLGKKVSHGCIRLGTVPAKEVYAMTPVGTKLVITN
ncbi:MAG: L,D-transpeptidase family protein [Candidatus Uhrbacteria bacterium]|nr:L,D-transpeptidase family protein [Candidatus Uhrbacteria bacterium]